MKSNKRFLELLEAAWGLFYFEGSSPDVGLRRQNFIRMALEKELGLEVEEAQPLERQVDLIVKTNDKKAYSLKTMESVGTLKVSWNSYPDVERLKEAAKNFEFKAPILFIHREGIYVFEVDDIEEVRRELGFDGFWSIPSREVNPRGFGIKSGAVRRLMRIAEEKGNFIRIEGMRLEDEEIRKKYFEWWYEFVKGFAEFVRRSR